MSETWVLSLGWENPLEKGMATHSSILAWRIPWTEESRWYSWRGYKELDMTEQLSHFSFSYFKKYYKIKPQKWQIKAKKKIRKKKKLIKEWLSLETKLKTWMEKRKTS